MKSPAKTWISTGLRSVNPDLARDSQQRFLHKGHSALSPTLPVTPAAILLLGFCYQDLEQNIFDFHDCLTNCHISINFHDGRPNREIRKKVPHR